MKKFWRENGIQLLIAAVLLAALVGVGRWALRGGTDPLSNLTNTIAAPVRSGISAVLNWAEGVYTYVFNYGDLQDELSQLRRRVATLEDEVRQAKEANRENEQLRKLLELREKRRDFVFETAKVTARGTEGWDSTLTLSKGSASGVEVNDCVITETGALVGVISQVGINWSVVDTVLSPNIEMGGQVVRANTAGILEGELSLMQEGLLKLAYLPLDTAITAGDEVLTSGRGDIYPPGLVVGKVDSVYTEPSGMNDYALVRPAVDTHELIEVFIIKEFEVVD